MKNLLFSFCLAFMFCVPARATHLMGGEITVQSIGNDEYVIAMLVYRDTSGIPMQTFAQFEIFDASGNLVTTTNTPYDSTISGNLLPQFPYGVELYLFVDTVTLTIAGDYYVGWSNCCRNVAIQNLTSPGGESMYLRTDFRVYSSGANSTPFFMVPAAMFLPIGVQWQYNPLPFDPDGDSLYWSIDAPLSNANVYCAGFTTPPADTTNPFSLDPITGTISWTANTVGNFVATVLVEEFRNGQNIGSIRRDLQFIVTSPSPTPMILPPPSWSTNAQGHYVVDLIAGAPAAFTLRADHGDSTAQLDMAMYGDVFDGSPNEPQFNYQSTGNGAEIEGTFQWNVPLNMQGQRLAVIRVSDGLYTMDEAIFLRTVGTVGVSEETSIDAFLFPNPAQEHLSVQLNDFVRGAVDVKIFSLNGQIMSQYENLRPTIDQQLRLPLSIGAGYYIVLIESEYESWKLPLIVR